MPIAALTLDFDPLLRLADGLVVRWQTVAIAMVITAVLIALGSASRRAAGLRADDLLFIAIGVVPGAVVGGRLGFALLHLELYRTAPTTLFDPSVGGLELALAVVGGAISGGYVAHLLGAPLGRWLHVATVPILFGLGAGKLAMILGGAGQGAAADVSWAIAFIGPGPWSSLAPAVPSHPAQAYEGFATLVLALGFALALAAGAFRSHDGRAFFIGIGLWALVRVAVSLTWRDPAIIGPLPAAGVIAFGVALGALLVPLTMTGQSRRIAAEDRRRSEPGLPGR